MFCGMQEAVRVSPGRHSTDRIRASISKELAVKVPASPGSPLDEELLKLRLVLDAHHLKS